MFLFQMYDPRAGKPADASSTGTAKRKIETAIQRQTVLVPKDTIEDQGNDYRTPAVQTFFKLSPASVASMALNDAMYRRNKAMKELEAAGIDYKTARVNDNAPPVEDSVNRQIQINARYPVRYESPDVTPIFDKVVYATSSDADKHDKLVEVYERYKKAVEDMVEIGSKITLAYRNIQAIKNGGSLDDVYGPKQSTPGRDSQYGMDLAIYKDIVAIESYPTYSGKSDGKAKKEASQQALNVGITSVEKMGAPTQTTSLNPEPQITEFFNQKVKYTEKYLTSRKI